MIDIQKDELYQKYREEGFSIEECAEHFGCSTSPIEDRLRKFGIRRRNRGDQPLKIPEEMLRELYVSQNLTTVEIAERFGCHNSTISRKLRDHCIPTDGPNHGHSVEIPEEKLVALYVDEERTTYDLAKQFNCNPTVIERRLDWYGVETRHTTAGNGDWQFKYGSNWRRQRRNALKAANFRCEICGITDGEHRIKYRDYTRDVGLGLDEHHRVSARLFKQWDVASMEDANSLSNLQVLCQRCHEKHGDRVGTSEDHH